MKHACVCSGSFFAWASEKNKDGLLLSAKLAEKAGDNIPSSSTVQLAECPDKKKSMRVRFLQSCWGWP
jgi:hypothetical protein